jgi:hypothetical protein
MGNQELTDFLFHSLSQKAASLLITRSPERAIISLEAEGFVNLQNPRDLELPGKRYVWVSMDNAKEIYDLALQYGTGQITFYDESSNKPLWINPKYKGNAIVLVIDKAALRDIEESGFPLRAITGITLQAA